MCGIWALLSLDKQCKLSAEQLYKLFMSIKHRGPDRSTFIDNDVYQIGFHRLAIMDPSTQGDQPFAQSYFYQNEKNEQMLRTIYVICNGEIYNYNKLKRQIQSKQTYIFKSHSDIQVLLPLYKDYGIRQMIQKLNGEFAFTIFDTILNTVTKQVEYNMYMGRDRFGIRPLFYTIEGNTIAIGSQLKSLIGIGSQIQVFPPRTWMHAFQNKSGKLQIQSDQYYKIGIQRQIVGDLYQNIREQFKQAVRIRLDSDRPIGCLLSGGLDSSLVAAVAAEFLRKQHKKLRTFSIGMPNSPDAYYAKIVADHIGSIHTNIQIPQQQWLNKLDSIIKTTQTFDITTIRSSTGLFLLTKWISQNTDIKVLLVGEGSDELAGGYLYFHKAPTPSDFHNENIRLLSDLQYFDCLRADRAIAVHGLEARVPFLDYNFVDLYLSIDPAIRIPQNQQINGKTIPCEKWLIRRSFSETRLLPDCVLWRKKQAFSDGVSSQAKSWYQIIQEDIDKKLTEQDLIKARETYKGYLIPYTKQALFYHQVFDQLYPNQYQICPYYWLPRWVGNAQDPSARTLQVYKEVEESIN